MRRERQRGERRDEEESRIQARSKDKRDMSAKSETGSKGSSREEEKRERNSLFSRPR